jgi:hypothetical protein
MNSSRLNQILPLKSSALWKGVGLGAVGCVLLLALVITSLRSRPMGFESRTAYLTSSRMGQSENYVDVVQADAPSIIHKAELALQVTNCAETQKKIEALAVAEGGIPRVFDVGRKLGRDQVARAQRPVR